MISLVTSSGRVYNLTRTRTEFFFYTRHPTRPGEFYPAPRPGSGVGYPSGLQDTTLNKNKLMVEGEVNDATSDEDSENEQL